MNLVWTLREGKSSRVIVERFQSGEDIIDGLNDLVGKNSISAGSFTALGAVEKACVGFFKGNGEYSQISLNGPLEVLSCVGNVSLKEGAPFVHAHITMADEKGRTYGGHVMAGCVVGTTFEVTLHAYPDMNLTRKPDTQTKLYLLDT